MARNRKPEYIKKLLGVNAPNGYKFDAANYLYNPNYEHEYPSFKKVIAEDDEKVTYRSIHFVRHHSGSGSYEAQVFSVPKKERGGWSVIHDVVTTHLEDAPRFSLAKMLSFC